MVLLETRCLTKHFGGLAAVVDLTFNAQEGEILGVIGPNGAGKTTLFNLISGVHRPTTGEILFRGERIDGQRPDLIAAKGLVRTFQHTVLFDNYTVRENVIFGFHLQARATLWNAVWPSRGFSEREQVLGAKGAEILELVGLSGLAGEEARNLAHGHQRALGVAIALAAQPKMLLLDEPVAGMNPEETTTFMDRLRRIRDTGLTILLVEHDMRAVMGLCDRIVVLNYGKQIAEGKPAEIQANSAVIEAYLGRRRIQ